MSIEPTALLQSFDAEKLEALVETMYLAADADGEFSTEERKELAQSIRKMALGSPHEEALAGDNLWALLEKASGRLVTDGREVRLQTVKDALGDEAARKGALGLAIRVMAADGIMRTSEREFIMELAEGLEIDRDVAADMVRDITRG
jgi:tellurite resistance protein